MRIEGYLVDRMKKLMVHEGVSSAELSRRVGIHPSQMSRYLSGQVRMSADFYARCLGEMGYTIAPVKDDSLIDGRKVLVGSR